MCSVVTSPRGGAAVRLATLIDRSSGSGAPKRVAPPRLRRALEAGDRHCAYASRRAQVGRCHAHHVHDWEHGGATDI